MSITRQTIKRLENEIEKIYPDKTRLFTCIEQFGSGLFYYDNKPYQTIEELTKGGGIKDSQTLIIIKRYGIPINTGDIKRNY